MVVQPRHRSTGLRTVAVFEAAKGALVLLAGCGLLALIHHDVQGMAEALVNHFHLNPAHRYPRIFLEAAGGVTDARLWSFAAGAAGYASLRFVEAYGLWRERRWAKWFAAISGGLYVPIEIYELLDGVSWPKLTLLLVNAAIVLYMVGALAQNKETLDGTN